MSVGASVVGDSDGSTEGNLVGCLVGFLVGLLVGEKDGLSVVGVSTGDLEGSSVGLEVGDAVVGTKVGSSDGGSVGESVTGDRVGDSVVGASDTRAIDVGAGVTVARVGKSVACATGGSSVLELGDTDGSNATAHFPFLATFTLLECASHSFEYVCPSHPQTSSNVDNGVHAFGKDRQDPSNAAASFEQKPVSK